MKLAKAIYEVTDGFPSTERFGLAMQMRRAAVSIPSNLAEGCGRSTAKDFSRFVSMAFGSICELETQLLLSIELKFVSAAKAEPLLKLMTETRKIMSGLSKSLNTDRPSS